ncbi:hypothetical protein [Virgisporangium aurantiacum]|uniref:hypothetical protein n=1 Tax=Virgisporangium aurantiacum TaxID=175570 RepID=UPI00194E27C0|nr:hypothetical protein [Virgisporangium aurantiacum]
MVLGLLVLIAAVGCGRDVDSEKQPSGMTASAEASTTAREILAALYGYKEALRIANESGTETPSKDLSAYLVDPLLSEIAAMIHSNRQKGVYYAGTSVPVDPKVTDLRADAEPPTAVVRACTDNTNYRLVYRRNNSPVPAPSYELRILASYEAVYVAGQGWRICKATNSGEPC